MIQWLVDGTGLSMLICRSFDDLFTPSRVKSSSCLSLVSDCFTPPRTTTTNNPLWTSISCSKRISPDNRHYHLSKNSPSQREKAQAKRKAESSRHMEEKKLYPQRTAKEFHQGWRSTKKDGGKNNAISHINERSTWQVEDIKERKGAAGEERKIESPECGRVSLDFSTRTHCRARCYRGIRNMAHETELWTREYKSFSFTLKDFPTSFRRCICCRS